MPNPTPDNDELLIHLDTAGLAALLKAVEEAMVEGSGHLLLSSGCGMTVTGSRPGQSFAEVIVKFAKFDCPDDRRPAHPAPEPLPRRPVLELQD